MNWWTLEIVLMNWWTLCCATWWIDELMNFTYCAIWWIDELMNFCGEKLMNWWKLRVCYLMNWWIDELCLLCYLMNWWIDELCLLCYFWVDELLKKDDDVFLVRTPVHSHHTMCNCEQHAIDCLGNRYVQKLTILSLCRWELPDIIIIFL